MFSRLRSARGGKASSVTMVDAVTPREKYEEFARENGRIKKEVEEALSELDELAREPEEEARSKDKTASD